jgi:ACS family hexuronate transporter-like MFS transporter
MEPPSALPRERAWALAAVATLAMSVSYVDRQVGAAVAKSVRDALDISAEQFGWLAGAFSSAYLVAAPVAGWLVDRHGARRGLATAVFVWSAVSAAHALAPSFAALLVLRVLLGVSESPSFPAAAQTVRRALPARDRSAAFGLLFTGSSIGAAIAAPAAVWLDVHFGWRAAFAVVSLLGTAWIPLWLATTRHPDVRAALAQAEDAREPPGVPHARREWTRTKTRAPTWSAWSFLREPAVSRALVLVLAAAPGLMFMYVWLPQYFEIGRGVVKASLGRYLWLPPLMGDLGMVGFGTLASWQDRRAQSRTNAPGAAPRSHIELVFLAALLEAGMALTPRAAETWQAMIVVGLAAAGGGGLYTLLTADMMSRIDPRRVSLAGGLSAGAQSLVYVVLNPLVGRWVDRTHSFDLPLVLLGLVAVPGAVAWAVWPVRRVGALG